MIFEQIKLKGKLSEKVSLNEEYVTCLLRITKVLQKRTEPFFIQLRKSLLPIVVESKTEIDNNKTSYISISSKSRYLLMDIYDYIKE